MDIIFRHMLWFLVIVLVDGGLIRMGRVGRIRKGSGLSKMQSRRVCRHYEKNKVLWPSSQWMSFDVVNVCVLTERALDKEIGDSGTRFDKMERICQQMWMKKGGKSWRPRRWR